MSFTFRPATREHTPLIIGIAGPTKSGKTMSALRVATGIANGGTIAMINAEGMRGHQYAEKFTYIATDITPPFSPERYTEALKAALALKPAVLIIDSASHMHDGPGGLLEYHDAELERLSKGSQAGRDKFNFMAWVKPKAAENAFIYTMLGADCPIILAFRAKEKIKIVNGKPIELGWQPIAGERIAFETLFTLMLPPHSKGKPDLAISEMREPFDTMVPGDKPLDEELGRRLAAWARGGTTQEHVGSPAGGEIGHADGRRAPGKSPDDAKGGTGTPPATPPIDGRVKEQILHEIVETLNTAHPGREREALEAKARLLNKGFGTRQWKAIQPLPSETLRAGLAKIQAALQQTALPESEPATLPPPIHDSVGPAMTDEHELHAVMDRWQPPISPELRTRLFKELLGTDDIERVDFAAVQDAIELFKRVAEQDPAAVAEVNRYLSRAA